MSLEFTEADFHERLTMFATTTNIKRCLPKKHKKPSDGTCPCCGKPCAPFTTCKKYRDLQNIGKLCREEVAAGRLRVIGKKGNALQYEKTPEGIAYYSQLQEPERVRTQGNKEKERRLKRLAVKMPQLAPKEPV